MLTCAHNLSDRRRNYSGGIACAGIAFHPATLAQNVAQRQTGTELGLVSAW
jgi:hypothetical protein